MNNENDMNNIADKDGKTLYAEYLVSNSLETLRLAADLGYPLAMQQLGRRLFHSNQDESLIWYQKAADTGDMKSQAVLKSVLADKLWLEKDYTRTLQLLHEVDAYYISISKEPRHDSKLALMYYAGLGCDVDYKKAAYYFNTRVAEFQNQLAEDNDTMQPDYWKDVATMYAREAINAQLHAASRHNEWEKVVALHSVFHYSGYTQYNNIAWAFCQLGNYAEALTLAKKALEGLPEPYVYDTLATALMGLGQYQDALTAFETCRDLYLLKKRKDKVAETEEKIKDLQSMLSK